MGIWEIIGIAAMVGLVALIILKRKAFKKDEGLFEGDNGDGGEE